MYEVLGDLCVMVEKSCESFNWEFCIPFEVLISWLNYKNSYERPGLTYHTRTGNDSGEFYNWTNSILQFISIIPFLGVPTVQFTVPTLKTL